MVYQKTEICSSISHLKTGRKKTSEHDHVYLKVNMRFYYAYGKLEKIRAKIVEKNVEFWGFWFAQNCRDHQNVDLKSR